MGPWSNFNGTPKVKIIKNEKFNKSVTLFLTLENIICFGHVKSFQNGKVWH